MKLNINTPEGTRDRLFAECMERRQVQSALVKLFRRRGYAEVITPEVEFYDLFVQSGNPMPQETMLKIIDRSGKIMVMRPDSTAPIARVAATKLKGMPLPQRLYYDQTVFRSGNANEGGSSEIAQCGIEMIGAAGLKSDLETIVMAVDALRCCGVNEFHIEIGHVDYFRFLTDRMNLPIEEVEAIRSCIEQKNYAQLNDRLEGYSDHPFCGAISRLPYLFGGIEVIDEACSLGGEAESLEYLRKLYWELQIAGYDRYIQFDLGLVHQIDYYTGVVFRGYAKGAGSPVLSGGRYDNLVEKFGRKAEATGFAVDVDAVGRCLSAEVPALNTVVHYEQGKLADALKVVDRCVAGTCELSHCPTLDETIDMARRKGASAVFVVDEAGERRLEI